MVQEKDIVLIFCEDKPIAFARIEEIFPDVKVDWYQVRLLVLRVPLKTVIWTLKNEYIEGGEFTMDGKKMRIDLVKFPEDGENFESVDDNQQKQKKSGIGKVISLDEHRTQKNS